MKTVSLVFELDFKKIEKNGRFWVKQCYKSKDFIFEYSAASFATFLHHNPKRMHVVDTDNVDLLYSKMKKYNVNLSNFFIRNSKELIDEWKNYDYCFFPMHYHLKYVAENSSESIVKLDNDLTCLQSIDDLDNFDGILAWKFERDVSKGRPYWGEILACNSALGTSDFKEYNTGVLGISKNNLHIVDEFIETTRKLISVDISSATAGAKTEAARKAKMYSTSAQTAENWVFHNNNLRITETNDYFFHHCYSIDAKQECIDSSKHLLK